MSLASEPNRTASEVAAPSVPPSDRKKVTDEVATPMSCGGRVFWTLMTSICIDRPRPAPMRSMDSIARSIGVSTPSVDMSSSAVNISAVPTTGSAS